MIIKSLSRRSKSFGQLLGYMQKEGGNTGKSREKREEIFHNLPFLPDTKNSLLQEFKKNSDSLKERKNGIALYHEIISLHPDDSQRVTPQILKNIAQYYLELRAPEGLGYGVVHTNTKNPHIHLMISANIIGNSQKMRLSKAKFQRVKHRVRGYIQKHYPELENTLQATTGRKISRISRAEEGMNTRNARKKKFSRKDIITQIIKNSLAQANSSQNFKKNLHSQDVQLYTRGKQEGIIWQGKKYRLKTLGLAEHLEQQKKTWEQIKQRKKSIKNTLFQKVVREWKERGFRDQIFSVLQQKKENKRLCELRKITEGKQKGKSFRRGRGF